jgi:hypothetical protein
MEIEAPQQTKILSFERAQEIQQRPGETSEALHERIRSVVVNSFRTIEALTEIVTPSWYTFDVSEITGIRNSGLVSTSTCKHELPMHVFVGIREKNWMVQCEDGKWKYILTPLGRELTSEEKNKIYDQMP